MSKLIFKDSVLSNVKDITEKLLCESFYYDDNVVLVEVSDEIKSNVSSYEYIYDIKDDKVILKDRFDVYTQDLDKESEKRLRAAIAK